VSASGERAALRLEGVEVALGGRAVLRGVDLELARGEVLVLAGRNGVGKTTLLRVASGLLVPEAGRVWLGERPLSGLSRRALAREIALAPQETGIPFPFRVGELVLMGRAPHHGLLAFESQRDVEIARAALERVGIAGLAERSVLEISGGERQLAVVARALAQQAPILLMDEPTAHLDLARRLELLTLARELAREGRAVLVVSHDLALTTRFASRIALLAEGRILTCGPPADVLRPELLRSAFGVDAEILTASDGSPVVVPRCPRQ
jgi:iron complex transport system ATP-binding protein